MGAPSDSWRQRWLRRPQSLAARRLAFQIHLWIGLGIGLYVLAIGLSGAVLVFKAELEQRANPDLYPPFVVDGPAAPMGEVVRNATARYPDHRLLSVFAPVESMPVFVAYLEKDGAARTVLLSASTGQVLGERPEHGLVRWLQALHVNLLLGAKGRTANGVGGLLLCLLCVTGAISWWPGIDRWRRSTWLQFRGWKRSVWELHGVTGFWTVLVVAMWAVTGAYFVFPQPFRAIVGALSAIPPNRTPPSHVVHETAAVPLARLLERAALDQPGAAVAALIVPGSPRGSVHVQLSFTRPAPVDATRNVHLYLDRFSGEILERRPPGHRTAGTALLAFMKPLHFGSFAGVGVKILWAMLGIAPPMLFITGLIMWWNRVAANNWKRLRSTRGEPVGHP